MADRYKKGDRFKAADANKLLKAATSPVRVTATGAAIVESTAAGININVPRDDASLLVKSYTVLITKKPLATDLFLTVRRVGYVNFPPIPCKETGETVTCAIDCRGEEFEVVPYYGFTAQDYEAFAWDRSVNGSPDGEATFFEVRREEGYWLIQAPAKGGTASIGLCIITAAASSATVYSVTIQKVKLTSAGPPPTFSADGASRTMLCWPGSTALDFVGHVSSLGQADAAYVPIFQLGSSDYVHPTYVFYDQQPISGVSRGDCGVT